jgi:hypothetical protein
MVTKKNTGVPFRIRKGISIGEADAESDQKYLDTCFIDGDYETLIDLACSQRIIVGRTGSGKSALIYHLKMTEEHVIEIQPENLSLNFISNSDIINILESAGVKLDIFYTLLWKHVFTVELLKSKFNLLTEEKTKTWLDTFLLTFRKKDQTKERALSYIKEWGDKFWEETEYRIVEITQKLENDIKTQMGSEFEGLKLNIGANQKKTEEVKSEFVHKAQKIVNAIQVKQLSDVMKLLAEDIFVNAQERRYIVIDKLDENWVDSDIRYRLIRSLIETIKSFKSIQSVKIIIALRQDLVQSVFDNTRDSGFQEEKFKSLFLELRWFKPRLTDLLNKRIEQCICEEYTTRSITANELFPEKVDKIYFHDYLFNRTLYRPRDAIAFVNLCLLKAEGKSGITAGNVKEAETEYSAGRIDALNYEWLDHYPKLNIYFSIIEKLPSQFKLSHISNDRIEDFALKYAVEGEHDKDPIIRAAYEYINNQNSHAFLINLTKAFFHIGVFGVKPDSFTKVLWSYIDDRAPTDGQIKPSTIIQIHPIVWARLGIVEAK